MKEIADFLSAYPPFDRLDRSAVETLAGGVDTEYHLADSVLLELGSSPLGRMLLVRAGRVEILDSSGGVVDEAGVGDVICEDAARRGLPYPFRVRAVEDTLVYRVPVPDSLHSSGLDLGRSALTVPERLLDPSEGVVSHVMRPVVEHPAATSIAEVARSMTQARTSCALVSMPDGELGVVTDDDLRRRVATGDIPVTEEVGSIATTPARTIASDAIVGDAYVEMVYAGIHHLVVLDSSRRPVGVLRVVDVASAELRHPLLVRSAIAAASTPTELAEAGSLIQPSLAELVDRGLPLDYVARLYSGVLDAVLLRAVEVTPGKKQQGELWLVQGSLARREPLPGSDVDTAVAWESGEQSEHLAQAARVLRLVERTGLKTCDRGANADNALFNRSLSSWREAAQSWLVQPDEASALALASITADSRPAFGSVVSPLAEFAAQAARHEEFLQVLLRHTLRRRPPLGFVRDFVVHHSGEHRGSLDLKRGGLVPISSLARWFALRTGDVSGSTLDRLQRASEAGYLSDDERDMLSGAFKVSMRLLGTQHVRQIRAGLDPTSTLRPDELDPLARRQLREAFRAIAAVQASVRSSWGMRSS